MKEFITYGTLIGFPVFLLVVFTVVEFIKEWRPFKRIKTKYVAAMVAMCLMPVVYTATYILILQREIAILKILLYLLINIPLMIINSIMISLSANGLSDFNNPVNKTEKDV